LIRPSRQAVDVSSRWLRAPRDPIVDLDPESSTVTQRALARPLVAAVAATAALSAVGAPALADPHPTHSGLVSADPDNHTPDVLDGRVNAFAQAGDTMIVGGSFSQVDDGSQVFDRQNLFAFSVSTGHVLPGFEASASGEVFDLQLTDDEQSVIAVGAFAKVDGQNKTSRVAEISVSDGSVEPGFASPRPNRLVRDVVEANGYYYIAGAFSSLNGQPRPYVAALNPDGSDSGFVDLQITGTNDGGATNVRSMDVDPAGSRLVIAGNFAEIDGEPRGQVAVIDIDGSSAVVDPWSAPAFAKTCGSSWDTYMRDVAFSPTGDFFVVATTGGPMGRQPARLLCDSISRWNLSDGAEAGPAWIDYTGGDTLTAAIVDDNVVYVGGHQRWLNNSYGHNDAQVGAVSRHGVAALDPANGLPYGWNPGRKRGYGVSAFALTPTGLWIGSDTDSFGGERHGRIAFCPIAGGSSLPAYDTGSVPGSIAMLRGSGKVQVRQFDGQSVGSAQTLATSQQWDRVRGAFLVDGTLYLGWDDATMTSRTFDGSTLGPSQPVALHGAFADLGRVQAIFFDAATHRVYYTLRGDTRLFYRYFEPQGALVGSWRYVAPASPKVNWSRVSSAFLVGGTLYFAQSQTGNLRAIGWNGTAASTSGPVSSLLGPSIDGNDYRAHGLVALD
jgi:hypothetical protein